MRKLKAFGFAGPFSGGNHPYFENNSERIFIPNPHGRDIGIPILKQMLKQLRISRDRFLKL